MRGRYIISPRLEAEEIHPRMAENNYKVQRWNDTNPGGELDQEICFYAWSLGHRAFGHWIDENFPVRTPWWVHYNKNGKP